MNDKQQKTLSNLPQCFIVALHIASTGKTIHTLNNNNNKNMKRPPL